MYKNENTSTTKWSGEKPHNGSWTSEGSHGA